MSYDINKRHVLLEKLMILEESKFLEYAKEYILWGQMTLFPQKNTWSSQKLNEIPFYQWYVLFARTIWFNSYT